MKFKPILTSRQTAVCDLLTKGFSNKEISDRLQISDRTVEDHRKEVFKRLGVRNAVLLTRKILLEGNPV